MRVKVDGGLSRRAADDARRMLSSRNGRYIPGDESRSLHAVLGRSAFNPPIPPRTIPAVDETTIKRLWTWTFDDVAGPTLLLHKGGAIYRAPLGDTGTFLNAINIDRALTTGDVPYPRGTPMFYAPKQTGYYICGSGDLLRPAGFAMKGTSATSGGIRAAGFLTPTSLFTATPFGISTWDSATRVLYTYRLYDEPTDQESAHGPIVEVPPWTGIASIELEWPGGIEEAFGATTGELGTHVRLYRTNPDEEPGIFWRIDMPGTSGITGHTQSGIPIDYFTSGAVYHDAQVAIVDAQNMGRVRADGQEGTLNWAEHGGPIPHGTGCCIFNDHGIVWGVAERKAMLFCSAQGYPELYPVNMDGVYQYTLPMASGGIDTILTCVVVGVYLMVFTPEGIFRVKGIPTFSQPGFDTKIQDALTEKDGVCGQWAACGFGLDPQSTSKALYVSPSHGLMVTDGISLAPVAPWLDFPSLVEPTKLGDVEVVNYPKFQCLRVFYTPRGGTENTAALEVSYAQDLRVSGPIDVKQITACYGTKNGVSRMYVMAKEATVAYVEDLGATDAQAGTEVTLDWETCLAWPAGPDRAVTVDRVFVRGGGGVERQFTVIHTAVAGNASYGVQDSVHVGPGGTGHLYWANATGQAHRVRLQRQGTGTNYLEGDVGQAPYVKELEMEVVGAGPQGHGR